MAKVPIDNIVIGDRRRDQYGDITGLAASMTRYGLIHPIVVDAANHLIAGGRRLRAAQQLGWTEIEARSLGELTDYERRLIELEENLRRLGLSAIEEQKPLARAALIVQVADAAKEVARLEPSTLAQSARVSGTGKRGPVSKPTSDAAISDLTGVPRTTTREARQLLAAVEKYPELRPLNGTAEKTLKMAAALDALPDTEREAVREKVRTTDSDTLNDLLGQPRTDWDRLERDNTWLKQHRRWADTLGGLESARLQIRQGGGIAVMAAMLEPKERTDYAEKIGGYARQLEEWVAALNSEEGKT